MTSDDRSDPAIRDSLDLVAVAVHGKRGQVAQQVLGGRRCEAGHGEGLGCAGARISR